MPATVHAIEFLGRSSGDIPAVCVCTGGERFLKRLALGELRRQVLGDDDGAFSLTQFEGRSATLRDVTDELSTLALFGGGRRLVVVSEADDFVTANRAELEDYVARPQRAGVLVLDVKTWPANTRLAKAVAASGLTIACDPPSPAKLQSWLVERAQREHDVRLAASAAEALVEIVGPELGILDQELAKLASYAGAGGKVTAEMVEDLVGGWRTKTAWEMLDATLAGNAAQALQQLDRLLLGGENPIGLLGMIGSTLRRFATAARSIDEADRHGRRTSLRQALQAAGFKPFILAKAEQQLRTLGRQRAGQLHRWLLETDLALKGQSHQPPRLVLEQLIVRLACAELAAPAKSS